MREEQVLVHNPVFVASLGWCKLVAVSPYAHMTTDKVTLRIEPVKPPIQEYRK